MQYGDQPRGNSGVRRPPLVDTPTSAPEWAGDLGDSLVRLTREQAEAGTDDLQFANIDPLTEITCWFGEGNPQTKRVVEPSMDDFDDRRVRVFRPSWGTRRLPFDPVLAQRDSVTITFTLDGVRTRTMDLGAFDHSLLRTVRPMRDFARRLTQTNKPVATWLHTVGHHVGTESLHERTFAMLADYHPAVDYIAGQPFTLVWPAGKELESHTPDIVLLGKQGLPLIVDVRNRAGAVEQTWTRKIPAIRSAVEALGMGYIVWTGMSRPFRMNLENFTEARVPPESYTSWAPVALALCIEPTSASDLADDLEANGYKRPLALTLIRRMIWRGALRTNMFTPYSASSMVERGDVGE